MNFTEQEQAVLRIVQGNLPDTLTPYADIAASAGMTEAQVLELLTRLKEDGTIRRFGASIKHQRTGWSHNAMVAWQLEGEGEELEALVEECGKVVAKHPRVSHAYYRPSSAADWPYTLYTMVHGKSEYDCLAVIEELRSTTPLGPYAMLESVKELKKISMTYFQETK